MQNDAPTLHGVFQGLNPLSLNPLPKMASPHTSISPNRVTQSPPKVFFTNTHLRYYMKYPTYKLYKFPANGYVVIVSVLL